MDALCYHRTTCRLCGSGEVDLILKLEPSAPVDAFVTQERLHEKQERFPMDLYLCRACGHGQLLDVVSPKLLFGDYIYTTASSPGLVDYFRDYADKVCDLIQPVPGSLAIDIGANDGTLLSFFKAKGLRVLGIDPAREIALDATRRGIETLPEFFNAALGEKVRQERGPAALVTANNVFAHADDLGGMAAGVRTLLADDGVFVCDVSYLLDMVDNMVFDFIYHEHLSHHSVKPFQAFMRKHGLHLFRVERTPSKGGTIRCFSQPIGGPRAEDPSVAELIALEEKSGLYQLETYRAYTDRINGVKQELKQLLKELKAEGKSIGAYGASATGTVLTYHFDLGESIDFIIDDNPVRQNRFSPGHHIPILSSRALVEKKPDCVLILAWRFADMIIKKNQNYLDGGGKFIVPLPEVRVIAASRPIADAVAG